MKRTIAVAGLILVCAASASAQKLTVRVIDRQDKQDEYDYAAVYNNVAVGKTFKVNGATFTLQLPDGRLAIVNCESKFAEHMAGRVGNRRSCRTPLVDNIEADFNGDNAKLIWPVSLDGKKMQSETYKILGILDKPKSN
jgi:opacity protein-like surface antigen